MAVSYGKGAKKKAIKLHSEVVRARADYVCQRCGLKRGDVRDNAKKTKVAIQCAHIVSRTYVATVTDERNGFSLCGACHYFLDKWPVEMTRFIIDNHGSLDAYNDLKSKVDSGHVPNWDEEIERLKGLLEHYESADWLPDQGKTLDH